MGCIHDVTAAANTDTPVLVGPVHQIEAASPRDASPLSPFSALLMNVKVSTGDVNDPELWINNQHMLDNAVSTATGGRDRTFVALGGAQVKAVLFVVGWAFEKTTVNLFGTVSSQAAPAPAPEPAPEPDSDTDSESESESNTIPNPEAP